MDVTNPTIVSAILTVVSILSGIITFYWRKEGKDHEDTKIERDELRDEIEAHKTNTTELLIGIEQLKGDYNLLRHKYERVKKDLRRTKDEAEEESEWDSEDDTQEE